MTLTRTWLFSEPSKELKLHSRGHNLLFKDHIIFLCRLKGLCNERVARQKIEKYWLNFQVCCFMSLPHNHRRVWPEKLNHFKKPFLCLTASGEVWICLFIHCKSLTVETIQLFCIFPPTALLIVHLDMLYEKNFELTFG